MLPPLYKPWRKAWLGRAPAVDNQQLKMLVEANPRTTVRKLALELGVGCATIMRHLGKKKKLDKCPRFDRKMDSLRKYSSKRTVVRLRRATRPLPKSWFSPIKGIITVWWTACGIIHYSFIKSDKSITAESYSQELAICHKKLKQIWPYLVNRKGPILIHDNARPHVGKVTQTKTEQVENRSSPISSILPLIHRLSYV